MKGWMAALAALAMTGFALGGALADDQKGARAGSGGSSSSSSSSSEESTDDNTPVEPLSIEGWDGGAYYDDFNDEYYCEVGDDYGEGVTIWFGWDVDGLYMTIEDPNTFNLEEFADTDATVAIDDFYKADYKAFSLDKKTLDFIIGHDRNAIDAFRKGEKMTLYPWDHWYTLYGLAKAIRALEDCYGRHS